jgi:hypothetical protein
MADYQASNNTNFIQAKVTDCILYKFQKSEQVSLMAQFVEFNYYESLFQPIIKATLLVNDTISLHTNFPLVGEETIEITIENTIDDKNDPRLATPTTTAVQNITTHKFMVSDVRRIVPDDKSRSAMFALDLYSMEYYHNSRFSVQRAYRETYDQIVPKILKEYLQTEPEKINTFNFEPAKGVVTTVVPNLSPLETIKWMAQRAVPNDSSHFNYMFFETMEGFHFETLQKLYKQTGQKKSYIYFSDMTEAARAATTPAQRTSLDQCSVTGIEFAKRYSTTEKIVSGFYENEYLEIDIFNRRINSTVTEAPDKPKYGMTDKQINTPEFIKATKTGNSGPGDRTRVVYTVSQNGGDDPGQPNYWNAKFGEAVRGLSALSQVQNIISLPGDTRVHAGQMISLELPEFHGFNNVNADYYLSGDYIITDIHHVLSSGMTHLMVLSISRDTFENDIRKQSLYKTGQVNNG